MSDSSEFPCAVTLSLPGPAGALEALTACPAPQNDAGATVVICHPHPVYGGTLHNKVVHTLARAFVEQGLRSVRFNFRGVGQSAGSFAHGVGETDDLLAVIEWVRARRPQDPIWLAGFSFGAYVALRAAARAQVAGLVTVAPAVHLYDFSALQLPTCPWLLLQGEDDEVVPVEQVRSWLAAITVRPQVLFLPGVGHFFHQRLHEVSAALRDFLPRYLPK